MGVNAKESELDAARPRDSFVREEEKGSFRFSVGEICELAILLERTRCTIHRRMFIPR